MANLAPRTERTDVAVIGSGAGGGVIAKELAEAGLFVVVLEAGKRFNANSDYHGAEPDFEAHEKMDVFGAEDPRQDVYTQSGSRPFLYNRVKGVGGSTVAYAAMSPRFHESDFRVRSEDGVADDWPISYADLEPYYTRVEYELGVAGASGAEANPFDPPRSKPYPLPPHKVNKGALVVKRGADKLGLHMVPSPMAIPSEEWGGRRACVGAGLCMFGCKIAAKSSIDVTYIPKGEATGRVDIRTRSMASEITVDRDGTARSVIYFDPEGRQHELAARAIVIAGNAVETPRLLLMSTSNRFPNGLANSSGLVGKYFTEHLAVFVKAVFSERLNAWEGIPNGGILQDYYATNRRNHFARGWTVVVDNNSNWPLAVARRVKGWGADHKARVKGLFGHLIGLVTIGEQLPDVRNQVTLDPSVKDHLGLPVPHLVNEARGNDQAMCKAIMKSLPEILKAAGATDIWEPAYAPGFSSHYLGTCRMGKDPKTSVADSWCRTHDVPNLFIGDGSVFVTSAAVNPALTISALATRTAEGIVAAFGRGDL